MKKLLLILILASAALSARADVFNLKVDQVVALVGYPGTRFGGAWGELDGYMKDVDQGPGNPRAIIRVNYTFTSEVRKKLAADHRVLVDALTAYLQKREALQKEVAEAVSGAGAAYDEKNKKHLAEIKTRSGENFDLLTLNLTPIAQDDLLNTDNPIPDSVLTAFTVLRAPVKP